MNRIVVIFFTFLFVAFVACVVMSCSKDKIQTPFTRMLGTWKEIEYATDDNGNGIIDSWEKQKVPSEVNHRLYFKPDSTGYETNTGAPQLDFRWRTYPGPTLLMEYNANDTVTYNITEISSVDLTLTTTTSLGLVWYYYAKQ